MGYQTIIVLGEVVDFNGTCLEAPVKPKLVILAVSRSKITNCYEL